MSDVSACDFSAGIIIASLVLSLSWLISRLPPTFSRRQAPPLICCTCDVCCTQPPMRLYLFLQLPNDKWAGDLYHQGLKSTEACYRTCGAQSSVEALKDSDVMVLKFSKVIAFVYPLHMGTCNDFLTIWTRCESNGQKRR